MPGRDRVHNLAIVGAIALGVALALLIGHWAGKGFPYPEYTYRQDKAYAADHHCDPSVPPSAVDSRPNPDQSVSKGPEPHERYDLCQQWRMAEAAERALIISWVQLGFGFLGIAGLLATVIYSAMAATAARRSADISAQAFVNSERAWITTKLEEVGDLRLSRKQTFFGLGIKLRNTNIGKTPALNVQSNVRLIDVLGQRNEAEITGRIIEELKRDNANSSAASTRMLAPQDHYVREWFPSAQLGDPVPEMVSFNIVICVSYNVLHDDKLRHTASVYMLNYANGSPLIRPSDIVIPAELLEFTVTSGGHAT